MCWIAEVHEPYAVKWNLTKNTEVDYDIIHDSRLDSIDYDTNRMKRRIIATISINQHRAMTDAGWLSHFAIESGLKADKVIEALINRILKHASEIKFNSVEITTTECQSDLREILLKIGFDIKQIYHQYILANNNFRIMKSQMGINLKVWKLAKDK